MTHIAICVWGICRSTDHTIESVRQHIFQPLETAGIDYTVYLHTYALYRPYENPRAKETRQQLKNSLWKLFKPDESMIEDQDEADTRLNLADYRTHGNPWKEEDGLGFQTLDNHIRALWSLYQVTKLWLPHQQTYDAILYIRPDVKFYTSIRPYWFQMLSSQTVCVPNFHCIDGVNDRFAFGCPAVMKRYGSRFLEAIHYSKRNPLHSESFLSWICAMNHIHVAYVPIRFKRIRADGTVCEADQSIGL
jgi:hypothetical protein